jgi:hypothetical protein
MVVCVDERLLFWFDFKNQRPIPADARGVYRSHVYPGLWLDGPSLLALDSSRVEDVACQGLASAEHAAFVERLRAARRERAPRKGR